MKSAWERSASSSSFRRCLPILAGLLASLPAAGSLHATGGGTHVSLGEADLKVLGARAYEEISDAKVAGDLNGDGFSDIVIGSELARVGSKDGAGKAYLVLGGAALPPLIDLASLGARGMVMQELGASTDSHVGHTVADAGDFNGDGFDDLIVSAPQAFRGSKRTGKVYVVFGGPALPASLDLSTLGAAGVTIFGVEAGDLAGDDVSRAGDVNGDGHPDIIIGASGANPAGRWNAGAAYVVFGGPDVPAVIDLGALGGRGLVLQGAQNEDRLGTAVGDAGDFDRDGIADVVIAAPRADVPDRADAGKVYVVFGSSAPPASLDVGSLGAAGLVLLGPARSAEAGRAVACGGDFDGDGSPDVLVGAELESPSGRSNAGSTYLVHGGSGLPSTIDLKTLGAGGTVLPGVGGGDASGHSVQCVGDFDGDGIDDILIGADKAEPHAIGNAGQAYLVRGREGRPATIPLSSLGSGGVYFNGEKAGDHAGHVVADAGDVNGDGGLDILIVARKRSPVVPQAPGGGTGGDDDDDDESPSNRRTRAGVVYLFHGEPIPPVADLACSVDAQNGVQLSWALGGAYDQVRVDRNGSPLALLPGTQTSFQDPSAPIGVVVYEVRGLRGARSSFPARCEVSIQVRPPFDLVCRTVDGSVLLCWQHAQPVDETRIYRDGTLLATLPGSPLVFGDTSPPAGDHEYRVTAVLGPNESAPAICRVTVPAPVRDLACRADGGDVTLTWTPGEPAAPGIRILRDGVEVAVVPGSSTSHQDHGVPPGVHAYQVQSISGEHSSAPAACSVRVLAGVRDLAGSSVAGDVTLSWVNGDVYEAIEVYRDGVLIATLPGDATGYLDPDLPPGSYVYTVVGTAGGSSAPPADVTVEAPAPVDALACRADGNAATVSWSVIDHWDSIEVSRDGTLIATLPGSASFLADTIPGPGSYLYEVVTVRGNGRSATARCLLKSPPAPTPLDCVLVAGVLKITWTLNGPYDSIEVVLNGEVRDPIPGTETSATYDLGHCGAARAEVRAVCAGSRSLPAECEAREIGSPFSFSCLAASLTVRLEWSNDASYDALRVERDGATIATLPGSAESYDDVVSGPGAHVYRVFGVSAGLETLPAICHVRVAEAPSGLQCSTDGEEVTLSWTLSGDHHSVIVERSGSTYAILPPGSVTFTDPQPLLGTAAYSVRLSHLGSTGPSASCSTEVLPAPDGLACAAEGDLIRLSWATPVAYTTIVILRNGLEVTPLGGIPGDAVSFEDGPVSPGLYLYEVRGLSGAGAVSRIAACEVESILSPVRLSCSSSDGRACLSWLDPRPYDGIEVLRDGSVVATLPGSAASFCEEGLAVGSYLYEVRGLAGGSTSGAARCEVIVPASPGGLSCRQLGSSILLSWVLPGELDAIAVHRDGSLWSVLPGTATSFLDPEVPLGTHTYEVRGGVGGDLSVPVSCAVAMVAPPADLSCVSDGSSVRLCWTPGDVYELVTVRRNGLLVSQPDRPRGDETCFDDEGLSPGVYLYEVTGSRGRHTTTSAACTVVIIPPVFGVACRINSSRAILSWSSGAAYDSIEVSRKTPSQAVPSVLATLPGTALSFIDQPLTETGEHLYRVVGIAAGVRSSPATCSAARLAAPAGLSCAVENVGINSGDVRLAFTAGEAYDELILFRNGALLVQLPGTATSHVDAGLAAGTHDYQVVGVRSGSSSDPARCTARVLLTPPPISSLTCRLEGRTVALEWSIDRPSDQTRIYRRAPGEASASLLATLPGSPLAFTDNAAVAPGDYRYEVSAVREGVESSRALCDVRKPRPPSDIRCLAADLGLEDGDVVLTWTLAEGYDSIEVLRGGAVVATLPGSAVTYTDPDRPIGDHSYRLVAFLAGSSSEPSAECVVTVPRDPPPVEDLACSIENGTATLRWTSGAVYDSIEVRRQRPGDADLTLIATLPGDRESYSDAGLTRAGDHLYEVTGVLGGRASALAACRKVLPAAPGVDPVACAVLQTGPDDTDVVLTWTNRDAYESLVVLRLRRLPAPVQSTMVSLRGDQTSFVDRRLPDGEYDYVVVGVVDGSSASSPACAVRIARPVFIRGETNDDGRHDIADAVYVVNYIFRGGPAPTCFDAADANDDGRLDISDSIWIIQWQFGGGPEPRPPFPACGKDPTIEDDLDCASFSGCS